MNTIQKAINKSQLKLQKEVQKVLTEKAFVSLCYNHYANNYFCTLYVWNDKPQITHTLETYENDTTNSMVKRIKAGKLKLTS